MIRERVRCQQLLEKVVSAEEAAAAVNDGANIGTGGEFVRGCAYAFFHSLAERAARGEVKNLSLWSANLLDKIEGILAEAGALKQKLGSHANAILRKQINTGKVLCNDVRAESLMYGIRAHLLRPLDLAVVDAVGITEEGYIIPSHTPVDVGSYVVTAKDVIVEIDMSLPCEIEGFYDHYLPDLQGPPRELPIYDVGQRIGTPYIPLDPGRIKFIVVSDQDKSGAKTVASDDKSNLLAEFLVDFLKWEIRHDRLPKNLFPIEIGLGGIAESVMKKLAQSDFQQMEIWSAVIGDGVLSLIETGKCRAATGSGLLISDDGWKKFSSNIRQFKEKLIMRPLEIVDHPEPIRRFRLIAINGAIEADIYGHVNSSHIWGCSLMNGVGGSAVFASNAHLSIFTTLSSSRSDTLSSIVPMVPHVDHSEHCVDVLVTEQGVADLRWLAPVERARIIIGHCAHPDYRPALLDYLERSMRDNPGHEPHLLGEAFSFHQRYAERKTMKL